MNFVNPLFLIGALAVSIPILLHLIRREHARKIEFPSLMFLRRISRKTIRYQKIRHLLLLLLRILALLLVVLAFMRPYREKAQAAAAVGNIRSAHIIVVDNSLSMSYQDRWARAIRAAADLVRKANPGDRFAVLEFTDRTLARTQLTDDPSEALDQIKAMEPTDEATRYGQALRAAEKFALDAGTGKRVIYLISDFQKNGWQAEDQDFRLGPGIELKHVDVGSDDFSNLTIRDVHVIEAGQGTASAGIKASVANFGSLDRRDVRVSLSMDGRSIGQQSIDVPKGASQAVEFQLPNLASGVRTVVLEVADSYLARDNRFFLTVEARGKTPVTVVEDGVSAGRRARSYFLSKALNVEAHSPYRMTPATAANLSLAGGLVIWNDVAAGTGAAQQKLQDFVRDGGGLAIVLGSSTRAEDFNRSFGSWLPVRVEGIAAAERSAGRPSENFVLMTDVRMDHPIFRPFGRPHSGSFSTARFFRHARLSAGAGAEIPARFDNGDPALVTASAGRGRVVIFASSADDSANDLPLKAVYAPFWQQILHYLENFQERRHWLEVGAMIAPRSMLADHAARQARGIDPGQAIVVLDPAGERLPLQPGQDSVALEKAGFYEIRNMSLNVPLAVNASGRESDLTHGDAEEMTTGWTSPETAVFSPDESPVPEELDRRQRIWILLLIAAALFLISELALSNREPRGAIEA